MNFMLRLFPCIWIPENIKNEIIEFQKKMEKLPIDAKFVEKENLHLTITFLGNKHENEVEGITRELDGVANSSRYLHVKLGGLKIIPSESYIRVIGIHVNPSREVEELIKKVASAIDGDYHEGTKMTLCRVRNVINKTVVSDFIEKNRDVSFGGFDIENISLVKSVLTGKGPVYETIHNSQLR